MAMPIYMIINILLMLLTLYLSIIAWYKITTGQINLKIVNRGFTYS